MSSKVKAQTQELERNHIIKKQKDQGCWCEVISAHGLDKQHPHRFDARVSLKLQWGLPGLGCEDPGLSAHKESNNLMAKAVCTWTNSFLSFFF